MNIPCVRGNHDEYCCTDKPLVGINPKAAELVEWTRRQLTEDDRQWLRDLPLVQEVAGFIIVHATLDVPRRWGYVFDKMAAAASFTFQQAAVCFFGHTHVPVAFVSDTVVRGGTYSKFKVETGKRYFVNPGAVGQPRDNNPKAAYVTSDLNFQSIELRRVDYDIPGAQGAISTAGLPKKLS
jgi:diadenosine tetraphosphatase ApaH/serine/threonine PP2A family protein phosphatase